MPLTASLRRPLTIGVVALLATVLLLWTIAQSNRFQATGRSVGGQVEYSGAVADGRMSSDAAMSMSPAIGEIGPEPFPPKSPSDTPASDAVGDRSVIYTTRLELRADNPGAQVQHATNAVKAAGGRVASLINATDDSQRYQVVFRVPSAQFQSVLDQLSALGKVESSDTSENDVTATLVDLDARLANSKAAVDRMRALMADARTVGEVISVESQLTQRESEYEALKARAESTRSAVQMATIHLTVVGPDEVLGSEVGFTDGIRSGWEAATTTVRYGLAAVGFALPLLPPAILVLGLTLAVRRYRSRRS